MVWWTWKVTTLDNGNFREYYCWLDVLIYLNPEEVFCWKIEMLVFLTWHTIAQLELRMISGGRVRRNDKTKQSKEILQTTANAICIFFLPSIWSGWLVQQIYISADTMAERSLSFCVHSSHVMTYHCRIHNYIFLLPAYHTNCSHSPSESNNQLFYNLE